MEENSKSQISNLKAESAAHFPEDSHAPQTETKNQKQETETMEVHKHPHHVMHKKKWTEYLLEFLMLFLAVFLGFLAENFREHEVEKERGKQYMESLLHDLQNDTANLNYGFPLKEQRLNAIDSFFLFFESYPNADVIPGNVFRYMRRSRWDRLYRRNTTTMDQLKNAGGFRLIRKKDIADSIAAYDLLWQRAEFWREGYITLQEKAKDMINKIVEAAPLLSIYRNQYAFTIQRNIVDSLSVKINRQNLNEFFNFLADQKIWTKQDKEAYQAIEQSAERLMALIKKEYDLE